jgi:hypothetical protein
MEKILVGAGRPTKDAGIHKSVRIIDLIFVPPVCKLVDATFSYRHLAFYRQMRSLGAQVLGGSWEGDYVGPWALPGRAAPFYLVQDP